MDMSCFRSALVPLLLPFVALGAAAQVSSGGSGTPAGTAAAATPATVTAAAANTSAARPATPLAAPTERETEVGIQIAHVGLTASGGLVDVRFKVLDAAKAKALLSNPANAPQLLAGDNPPLVAPHHALKGARFGQGQTFYILYPNQRAAIKPGGEVSVAMGPARLGPVKAQ